MNLIVPCEKGRNFVFLLMMLHHIKITFDGLAERSELKIVLIPVMPVEKEMDFSRLGPEISGDVCRNACVCERQRNAESRTNLYLIITSRCGV